MLFYMDIVSLIPWHPMFIGITKKEVCEGDEIGLDENSHIRTWCLVLRWIWRKSFIKFPKNCYNLTAYPQVSVSGFLSWSILHL